MLKDRSFNLAFLISLLWHLMLIFCVTVVILPANIKMTKPSTVSFLGPILEKTSFEIMLGRKSGSSVSEHKGPVDIDKRLFNNTEEEMARLNKVSFNAGQVTGEKENRQVSSKELFGDFKFTPQFHAASSAAGYKEVELMQSFLAGGDNISIEGPLAAQELLFKPELPIIPRRTERGEGPLAVKLKIQMLKNGEVDSVALLAPSGEPAIDLAMINYVKKFRFSTLSSRTTTAAIWGIIKIKFENR